MKLVVFLVCTVLFLSGIGLFGYAFAFDAPWNSIAFVGGVGVIAISLAIPVHAIGRGAR